MIDVGEVSPQRGYCIRRAPLCGRPIAAPATPRFPDIHKTCKCTSFIIFRFRRACLDLSAIRHRALFLCIRIDSTRIHRLFPVLWLRRRRHIRLRRYRCKSISKHRGKHIDHWHMHKADWPRPVGNNWHNLRPVRRIPAFRQNRRIHISEKYRPLFFGEP